MNKLKRFLGTTMIYLLGSVLSKLVSFLLLPIYTGYIEPEDFGIYDLVVAFINLIAPIVFCQIWDGMFRLSFEYDRLEDKYTVVNNSMFVCVFGTIFYLLVFSVLYFIMKFEYAWAILIYGFFFSINYQYGYMCRVFLKNKLYAISGFINTLVTAVVNIILIVCYNYGVKSLYIAPAVGILVQNIIIEIALKPIKWFSLKKISKKLITKMIKFSIPLCVAGASYWLLSGFSKVMITSVLGSEQNGLFAVATKFSTMVTLVITIFQYAWNELAYLMSKDKDRVETYNVCVDLLIKFVILGSSAICIFIKLIFPLFVDQKYYMAVAIIPATIIGSIMNAMAGFVGTLFMTENQTRSILYSTLISSGVNIGLCLALIYPFGIHGGTIALGVAFTVLMLIRLVQAKKKIGIKIDIKTTLALMVVLVLSVLEFYLTNSVLLDVCCIMIIGGIFIFSLRKYIKMLFHKKKAV